MYRVIHPFVDKVTKVYYAPGETYPKTGEADPERIKTLTAKHPAFDAPLIESVKAEKPKAEEKTKAKKGDKK